MGHDTVRIYYDKDVSQRIAIGIGFRGSQHSPGLNLDLDLGSC